jgi:hypothetical protein
MILSLEERSRRLFAGLEALRLGHGGTKLVSEMTGLDEKTVRRGRREVQEGQLPQEGGRQRQPGAGRPSTQKNAPI